MVNKPPKWIDKCLERFCDPYLWEGIHGDLHEIFFDNVENKGYQRASWIYFFQALGFLRMRFKRKLKTRSNMGAIWNNYLTTSLRSIKRNKVYFGINLIGLVLAISCSLYAFVFLKDELSYDKGLNKNPDTYRLYKRYINVPEDIDLLTSETSGLMGPTMAEEYPEIINFTRLCTFFDDVVASTGDRDEVIPMVYFADSTFFDFFNFKLISGNPDEVLRDPSSVVLTSSIADRLFPDSDPIGQTFKALDGVTFKVTGVMEDLPKNTHLNFDALMSWSTTVPNVGPLEWTWMNNWLAQGFLTYLQVNPNTDIASLTDKLPDMMNRHFEERADQYFLRFQPWEDVYLFSDEIGNLMGTRTGSFQFILILGLSALLILIVAIVNCINISLSKLSQNNLEIGVRKVMGSSKRQLVNRFITESFLTTITALILSYIILFLILPELNLLTGKSIVFSVFVQPLIIGITILFIVLLSLFVGLYPALVKSRLSLSEVIRKSSSGVGAFGLFRKFLLGIQYFISPVLIVTALMMYQQIDYLKNKPLGFNKHNLITLGLGNEVGEQAEIFEAELLSHPNILSVSSSRNAIGHGSYSTTVFAEGREDDFGVRIYAIDQQFIDTYEMNLLEGRNFLENSSADSMNVIVNQTLVEFLGWESGVGKRLRFNEDNPYVRIVGVLDDFHYSSLSGTRIEPMVIYLDTEVNSAATIRIGNGDIAETLSHIEASWNKVATRTPFSYQFVENWYANLYNDEIQSLKTASVYSIISIVLCALGLFGLTALALQNKRKEISIRKVLGANRFKIVAMINRQFLLVIGISFFISIPVTYRLIQWWLNQFEYHANVNLIVFIMGGVFVIVASMGITSLLALRAASVNPSENLNNE